MFTRVRSNESSYTNNIKVCHRTSCPFFHKKIHRINIFSHALAATYNVFVLTGQEIPDDDPCQTCFCQEDGDRICASIACALPFPCEPFTPPGECCPICKDGIVQTVATFLISYMFFEK